jgi:hypothetical protein
VDNSYHWGLVDHSSDLIDGSPQLLRVLEERSVNACIDELCKLLDDIDLYQKAAHAIDGIKHHGDPNLSPLINAKLEALHEQGIPVQIQEVERIEEPFLLEIRNLVSNSNRYNLLVQKSNIQVEEKHETLEN